MNVTVLGPWLLGGGAFITSIIGTVNNLRDRSRSVEQAQSSIKLTDEQRKDLAQQASSSYTEERIRIETWWKEQFDAVSVELEKHQKYMNRMKRRMKAHREWDEEVVLELAARGGSVRHPPSLDPDEPNGD